MSEAVSIHTMAASANVAMAIANLLDSAGSALRDDPRATKSYLLRAVSLLDAHVGTCAKEVPGPQGGLAAWQVRRINDYIDRHIGAVIRTSELACLVDLSVSHFSRAFKQSFGDTATSYVAQRRIQLARRLMLTTDAPLAQIALDCGLCDQSHLTRVFRRYVGTSPRTWRRRYGTGPAPNGKHPRRRATAGTTLSPASGLRRAQTPASPG